MSSQTVHQKQTLLIQSIPSLTCADRSDFCGQAMPSLCHDRAPWGVVDPAIPAGTEGHAAPAAPQAAQGVGAADACGVPLHLVPPAAAAEAGPVAIPLGNCVIQLLLQAPATPLAQLSHPGAGAAMLRGEPKEDDPHVHWGEGSG